MCVLSPMAVWSMDPYEAPMMEPGKSGSVAGDPFAFVELEDVLYEKAVVSHW
jgi:hypothetical protein